ncbi:MAG TPA: M20/M25/M40 family metallo-hydrolase [Thermoleophilaceae bacterium]|jgi:tripeptide aminopeptidase|nr:M20/M25/M40 family metallo-hydrolase [Thermoleophilaceae bacterium]
MADRLVRDLAEIGISLQEDHSAKETGSNAGNLLGRIPGPDGAPVLLLCAHMDTVPITTPVKVVDRDGRLENEGEGILGADNKAAVAVIVEALRRIDSPPVGIEVLFTTCEELSLAGAKAFDQSQLQSAFGFVFDHATPIGEVIVAAPTLYRIQADLHGQAAHAGLEPEKGRNAIAAAAAALSRIQFGRLDEKTTTNVGRIEGGTAINVVAERCSVELETRSVDEARAAEVASAIVDAFTEAASDLECDVETIIEEQFRGYQHARTAPPVGLAAAALDARGVEPQFIRTGSAADANVFVNRGLPVVNMANGTQYAHQPNECVTVEALETMLGVVLELVRLAP